MDSSAQSTPRVRSTAPAVVVDDSLPDLEHITQKGQFPEALKDSDSDGISDLDDNCRDTPANWPKKLLDHCGCPIDPCTLDSDGDGIKDCEDRCPDTLHGLKVLANGCPAPITEAVTLRLDVKFDFATARLSEQYIPDVEQLRALLLEFPDLQITLEGHTDNLGGDRYNLALSEVRAKVVRQYLLDDLRINRDRIKAVGYGESRPLASNRTKAGRALNRRTMVEIHVDRVTIPPNSAPAPIESAPPD